MKQSGHIEDNPLARDGLMKTIATNMKKTTQRVTNQMETVDLIKAVVVQRVVQKVTHIMKTIGT